ncbi:MAG: LptF/LptG family permease [Dysgonomonas sp.]
MRRYLMLHIKRLYTYILLTFLPLFLMTFAICSFILLMQFLWKYVEDLVGKGLDTLVLAELFFYAILSVIPLALPLAILLASLMTFGNLGEKFELLAIKAAGISLLKSMRPLIILMIFVCIGAFYFQNEAMPRINVKITSLLRSIKMKSPELDIPEGSFYNEINNYNLYVKTKDPDTGMLYDVKIYDISKGFNNMAVIVCDSAKMRMASGKDYLLLSLYSGQQFANFQKPGGPTSVFHSQNNKFVPYGRENFKEKEIIIPFDATFNRMDESQLQGTQIAKNIKELKASIDSISHEVDSMNVIDRKSVAQQIYRNDFLRNDTAALTSKTEINTDSLWNTLSTRTKFEVYANAITQTEINKNDVLFRSYAKTDAQSKIRYHKVEWHRKFTLSFACLVFFFIGAPLGAIIRKGGLGMPVVVSVILFIIYYIFDNVGRKMARDGVWDVWQGIWLSSFILFPLGIWLTYKAMNESALFNMDAYRNFYNKLFGDPNTKSSEKLYSEFITNSKYTSIAYLTVIITFILKILNIQMLSGIANIIMWIAIVAYILLLIKTITDFNIFYKKTYNKKTSIKNIIIAYACGILVFPLTSLYFQRKIKPRHNVINNLQN